MSQHDDWTMLDTAKNSLWLISEHPKTRSE